MSGRRIESITPFRDIDLGKYNIAQLSERRVKMRKRLAILRGYERVAEKEEQGPVLAEARKRIRVLLALITKTTAAMGRLG